MGYHKDIVTRMQEAPTWQQSPARICGQSGQTVAHHKTFSLRTQRGRRRIAGNKAVAGSSSTGALQEVKGIIDNESVGPRICTIQRKIQSSPRGGFFAAVDVVDASRAPLQRCDAIGSGVSE